MNDETTRKGWATRPDEKMKVLGHQDVADNFEIELSPQLGEGFDELAAESFGIKQLRSSIGTGSDKMQVVKAVEVPLTRHV